VRDQRVAPAERFVAHIAAVLFDVRRRSVVVMVTHIRDQHRRGEHSSKQGMMLIMKRFMMGLGLNASKCR
jgi:hypothetical protein